MLLKKPITIAVALLSNLFIESVGAAAVDLRAHTAQYSSALVKRKGINCKGSSNCMERNRSIFDFALLYVPHIPDNHTYMEGEHIACSPRGGLIGHDGICLFLQKTSDGILGSDVKKLFNTLVGYGCDGCGSVPINLLYGINDNENGELTVNYVSHRDDCNGICGIGVRSSPSNVLGIPSPTRNDEPPGLPTPTYVWGLVNPTDVPAPSGS